MGKLELSRYEPFFGTPHLNRFSVRELRQMVKDRLDIFFKINFEKKGKDIDLTGFDFDKLLELLEIIQYGKDRYPFLISLDFNTAQAKNKRYNLREIHIWKDPHYENEAGMPSAFKGDIPSIPSLFDVKRNPQILIGTVKNLIVRGVRSEEQYMMRICIGGTKDVGLVIGIPKKEFFTGKAPVYSIHKPIAC